MGYAFDTDHVADVELRWLKRTVKTVCDGGYEVGREETVLQVRKLWREAEPIDASVSNTKAQNWSEWSDVPTVAE